jgi:hypothetical protein
MSLVVLLLLSGPYSNSDKDFLYVKLLTLLISTSNLFFKPLDEGLDFAIHPQKHMEIISRDLLVHGVSIFEDIEKANIAYKDGNYK